MQDNLGLPTYAIDKQEGGQKVWDPDAVPLQR